MLMLVFVCRAPCIGSAFLFRISVVGVFHELARVHFSWPSRFYKKNSLMKIYVTQIMHV